MTAEGGDYPRSCFVPSDQNMQNEWKKHFAKREAEIKKRLDKERKKKSEAKAGVLTQL